MNHLKHLFSFVSPRPSLFTISPKQRTSHLNALMLYALYLNLFLASCFLNMAISLVAVPLALFQQQTLKKIIIFLKQTCTYTGRNTTTHTDMKCFVDVKIEMLLCSAGLFLALLTQTAGLSLLRLLGSHFPHTDVRLSLQHL